MSPTRFRGSGFKIFAGAVEKGSLLSGPFPAPGAAKQRPRSFFDKMNDWARRDQGAAGLGYIVFDDGEAKGPYRQESGRLSALTKYVS